MVCTIDALGSSPKLGFAYHHITQDFFSSSDVSAQHSYGIHASIERAEAFINEEGCHVDELLVRVDLVALSNILFGTLEGFNLCRGFREALIEGGPFELLLFAKGAAPTFILLNLFWIDNFDEKEQVRANEGFFRCLNLE